MAEKNYIILMKGTDLKILKIALLKLQGRYRILLIRMRMHPEFAGFS